jgi:hypothetical protein
MALTTADWTTQEEEARRSATRTPGGGQNGPPSLPVMLGCVLTNLSRNFKFFNKRHMCTEPGSGLASVKTLSIACRSFFHCAHPALTMTPPGCAHPRRIGPHHTVQPCRSRPGDGDIEVRPRIEANMRRVWRPGSRSCRPKKKDRHGKVPVLVGG